MNRKLATAALLLAVPGLAGATALPGPATAQMSTHTLRLVIHETASHNLSQTTFVGTDRVRSRATHQVVGFDSFTGRFFPKSEKAVVQVGLALRGGIINLRVSFKGENPNQFHGPILGGTGAYRGISGTVDGQQKKGSEDFFVTLHYTL